MVRLKERACAGLREQDQFQFHYGTIKSADRGDYAAYNVFQFHYGTIKR